MNEQEHDGDSEEIKARFRALGISLDRIEVREQAGRSGLGVSGDRAWVSNRITREATLRDLAYLIEVENAEPGKRKAREDEEARKTAGYLREFERRFRRRRRGPEL